jgi:hypothetical protein
MKFPYNKDVGLVTRRILEDTMNYLGIIVILLGIFIGSQGYNAHANLVMLTGFNFVLTGLAIAPWPFFRTA